MMKIQVLHNRECTFWQQAWQMLEGLIKEKRLEAKLEEILISSDEEATHYHFAGSPQVMIDGRDIDPEAGRITTFHASGCRPYFYKGGYYDYPPREMVEEALQRITNDRLRAHEKIQYSRITPPTFSGGLSQEETACGIPR